MALTAHQELQRRKQQKFRRELERAVTDVPPHKVGNLAEYMFQGYTNKPSLSSLVQMVVSSKFGGHTNAVSDGGAAFMVEGVTRVFNQAVTKITPTETNTTSRGTYFTFLSEVSPLSNALFAFELDARLMSERFLLDVDQFVWATDVSSYLFLDKDTRAFGLVIIPRTLEKIEFFREYYADRGISNTDQMFANLGQGARLVLPGFDSGRMEYISVVEVIFGTTDKLIASLPDRQQHDVRAHTRTYQSGVVSHIAPQKRRNPLRLVVQNDLLKDHIVYQVKDADGQVRYIGEGKSDRWKHVNSGVSHNFKINEHRFIRGEMDVSVLYEGLTKTEALSIEKALLKKHAGAGLWNTKDYEPFYEDAGRSISDQEIDEYLNRPPSQ